MDHVQWPLLRCIRQQLDLLHPGTPAASSVHTHKHSACVHSLTVVPSGAVWWSQMASSTDGTQPVKTVEVDAQPQAISSPYTNKLPR